MSDDAGSGSLHPCIAEPLPCLQALHHAGWCADAAVPVTHRGAGRHDTTRELTEATHTEATHTKASHTTVYDMTGAAIYASRESNTL